MSAKTNTIVLMRDVDEYADCSELLVKAGRGHGRIVLVENEWGDEEWDYRGALVNPDLGEICDRWRKHFFPGRAGTSFAKPKAYRVTIEEISLEEAGVMVEDNRDA